GFIWRSPTANGRYVHPIPDRGRKWMVRPPLHCPKLGEDPTCQSPSDPTRPAPSSPTGVSTGRWGSRRSFCFSTRRLDTPSRATSRLSRRLESLVSGLNWSSPSARSRPHRRWSRRQVLQKRVDHLHVSAIALDPVTRFIGNHSQSH